MLFRSHATLTARQLRRRVLGSVLNPMLAYAVYGTYGAFVARGRTESAVPMIPVGGGIRYLPVGDDEKSVAAMRKIMPYAYVIEVKPSPAFVGTATTWWSAT